MNRFVVIISGCVFLVEKPIHNASSSNSGCFNLNHQRLWVVNHSLCTLLLWQSVNVLHNLYAICNLFHYIDNNTALVFFVATLWNRVTHCGDAVIYNLWNNHCTNHLWSFLHTSASFFVLRYLVWWYSIKFPLRLLKTHPSPHTSTNPSSFSPLNLKLSITTATSFLIPGF